MHHQRTLCGSHESPNENCLVVWKKSSNTKITVKLNNEVKNCNDREDSHKNNHQVKTQTQKKSEQKQDLFNVSNNNIPEQNKSEQKEQPCNNDLKVQTARTSISMRGYIQTSCNTVIDHHSIQQPVLDSFSFSSTFNHKCYFNELFSFSIKNHRKMIFIDPISGYNSYDIDKKSWINEQYDSKIKYSTLKDRALLINDDLLIVSSKNNCLYFYDFSDLTEVKFIKQFQHMLCETRGMCLIEENNSINEYSFVIFGIIDEDTLGVVEIGININYQSARDFNPKHIACVTICSCNMRCCHLYGCDWTCPIGSNYQILKNNKNESIVVIMIEKWLYVWNSHNKRVIKSKQVCDSI